MLDLGLVLGVGDEIYSSWVSWMLRLFGNHRLGIIGLVPHVLGNNSILVLIMA